MNIYKASAYAQSTSATHTWYTRSTLQPLADYVVGVTGQAELSELGFPRVSLLLPGERGDMWERVVVDGVSCLRVRRVVGIDAQWSNVNSSLGRAASPNYTASESPLWTHTDGELTPKE